MFPQMSCKAILAARADVRRVARVTGMMRDVMLAVFTYGWRVRNVSKCGDSHRLVISGCEATLDCTGPTERAVF